MCPFSSSILLVQTLTNVHFDSLMNEVSSSDMLPHHGTVIAMHLLQQSRNLSKLRQHMEHLYKNGMGYLGSHIDGLVSILITLLYCIIFLRFFCN